MGYIKILVFLTFAICGTKGFEANQTSTEELIRSELDRFEALQDKIVAEKFNVTVLFTQTIFDDDGDFQQFDSLGFQPLLAKGNVSHFSEPLDEKSIELIFEFAKKFNFTAVASQEKFSPDGSILSKYIYHHDITIAYENKNSTMIYKNKHNEKEEEKEISSFIKQLRDYEVPASVHKVLYNIDGQVVKVDNTEHKPKKVKLLEAENIEIDMQMKVSEALKRTIIMKESPTDRLNLLCKFLGIQYPSTKWQAVIGNGKHYIKNSGLVKMLLDGEIYTVFKTAESNDDDDDD